MFSQALLLATSASAAIPMAALAPSSAEFLTESEALGLFFPTAERITRQVVIVPDPEGLQLRGRRAPRYYFRHEAWAKQQLLGFAIVDDVMGKARPITYMLATDGKGEVLGIELLAYRESHGGEIAREAFRDQFKGRNHDDALRIGGEIKNIAGATISCRSITDGVADLLDLIHATPMAAVPAESDKAPAEPHDGDANRLTRVRVLMNAPLSISLELDPDSKRQQAIAQTESGFQEVARLEGILSAFKPGADPARLKAAAQAKPSKPVSIQPETHRLLEAALQVAHLTDGATTPLAGPLLELLKRAPDASPAARAAAAKLCSAHLIKLGDAEQPKAQLLRPGMAVNFGASGKGLALDAVREQLQAAGAKAGVLDFGGQLLCFGPQPTSVELPKSGAEASFIELQNGSLATTADSERGGPQSSHLIDARTGASLTPHGAVTVLAKSALAADLWSSALYVLGEEAGLVLAEKHRIAARFARGELPARTTSTWPG